MKVNGFDLAAMVQGYLACAIWTMPEDDDPDTFCTADFTADARRQAEQDCTDFAVHNPADVADAITRVGYEWSRLGHDLWLTRNGHGAGFWDRKELEDGGLGDRLSDACRHKSMDCYAGDDGRLHFMGSAGAFVRVPATAG